MVEITKMLSEEHYGSAFSLHLGHKRVVVLSSLEAVKTAYGKQMNRRPDTSVGDWRENRFGVIFSNGQDWHEQRKMFVGSLHKTGFKKDNVAQAFERMWRRVSSTIEANVCMDDAAEVFS